MKQRSNNQYLFLLVVGLVSVSINTATAFVSSATRKRVPSRVKTRPRPSQSSVPATTTQLYFDLTSALPVLKDSATMLPHLAQQMTQALFFPPVNAGLTTAHVIQAVGETAFVGMLAIAAIQGAMIMKQYQNNPNGGLIVPPGLTEGMEDANSYSFASSVAESRHENTKSCISQELRKREALSEKDLEEMLCDTKDTALTCGLKKQWYHVTTQVMAVALVPLAAMAGPSLGLAAWIMRYGHLVHLAVIFGLTHIYDFFRKLPTMEHCPISSHRRTNKLEEVESLFTGEEPRVLVLGDSMSVGIGTCEIFDDQKVYDIPLHKDEHLASSEEELKTSLSSKPGPMFPRALAYTLSQRLQEPVAWRSAGVDGGSTVDIAEHLLGVVQDEVDKGHAPDVVVVLTGSNDLKHILKGSASVKGFRFNLMQLADQIRAIAPNTKVVYPALPTYRMDQKSILNVFPLSICLDSIMGLWDAQKMTVADQCPGVLHVDLTVADVNNWYKTEDGNKQSNDEKISLISADGIHPNARCYEKWGSFVADKLVGTSLQHQHQQEQKKTKVQNKHNLRPAYAGGFHLPATFGAMPTTEHH